MNKDAEGMRVIADLHGGDSDDPIAVAEFQEIKDKVHEEVRMAYPPPYIIPGSTSLSGNLVKIDHIK